MDAGERSGASDDRRFLRGGLLGGKKAEEAERRKLRSHVEVLLMRARRFCDGNHVDGQSLARQRVVELINQPPDNYEDMEGAHQYADQLEELLPQVADDAYLGAVLAYELAGGDPDEPIKLSTIAGDAALRELRCTHLHEHSSSIPCGGSTAAERLSLLYRARADRLRHERLMAKLRGAYFLNLAITIVALLGLLAVALIFGNPSEPGPLDREWAQLLLVASAGALGSVLAATFRIRDTIQLNPLRGIAAITQMQPLIGASLGLVSWLILTSDLVTIGGTNNQAWPTQAVVAFASGFSEPLFLNLVGTVIGKQRQSSVAASQRIERSE